MSYFGSNSNPDCQFIGKRCGISGVDGPIVKGTIVDSSETIVKYCTLFAVKLDGSKYITQLFYGDIQIDGWDAYKHEFNDAPENKV